MKSDNSGEWADSRIYTGLGEPNVLWKHVSWYSADFGYTRVTWNARWLRLWCWGRLWGRVCM